MERAELESKANDLELEFDDKITDEDLQKLIDEKSSKKDDDDDKNMVSRDELKKVIAQRDAAKKDKRLLSSKLKDMESKLSDVPDKESFEKAMKELKGLKKYRDEIEKEKEEKELEKKDDLAKAEIRYQKELDAKDNELKEKLSSWEEKMKEFTQKMDEKDSVISNLRVSTLKGEIISAAAKYDAWNPSQIFKLLKDEFEYDKNLDRFEYVERDEKGKPKDTLSIEERVKQFLSDEDNENLVKGSISKDKSFYTKKDDKTGVKTIIPKKTGEYDPKDEDLLHEADMAGMKVEDWIEIKKMKDKKLHGKKEKSEE